MQAGWGVGHHYLVYFTVVSAVPAIHPQTVELGIAAALYAVHYPALRFGYIASILSRISYCGPSQREPGKTSKSNSKKIDKNRL